MPEMKYLIIFLTTLLITSACTESQRKKLAVTPSAYGKLDNIMLVTDEYNWNGATGDTFKHYFQALYPVTPQPEPLYDIKYKKPKEFLSATILKSNRSILILGSLDDKDDKASELIRKALGQKNIDKAYNNKGYRIAIQKDRWAKGQLVVYWFAPDRNELIASIIRDHKKVMDTFNEFDTDKYIEQLYIAGQNIEAGRNILNDLDLTLKIPREYFVAHQDSNSMWMRKETDKVSSNLFIHILPLADSTAPTPENHHRIRDQLTRQYFSTHIEGSYMKIDDRVLPLSYQSLSIKNNNALQARGIWSMVNDFMGGSFISYMIEDSDRNRVIFLDGFVHAPGQKKRPELRRLDMVFSTFDLDA